MLTERSIVPPGATSAVKGTDRVVPIFSPESYTMVYDFDHVQVPMFLKRHVFVNVAPGSNLVPSGTVTSLTNCAQSQVAAEADDVANAAGTSDNNIATSNIIEAVFNRDFMRASSNTSSHLERQSH